MSATQKKTRYIIGIDEAGRAVRKGEPRPDFIIGIDEAGRGPLAGPLVVAGIRIRIPATTSNAKFKNQNAKIWKDFKNIRDSKKLTPNQREEWFRILTTHPDIEYAVARVSPKIIDKINIYQATLLGARRVCFKLRFGGEKRSLERVHVFLDGGLYVDKKISQQTIIKGDEKIPVISAASIIAKVTRARMMRRLHKKYPEYGFDRHKGYGTKQHVRCILKMGHTPIHRRSFSIHINGSSIVI